MKFTYLFILKKFLMEIAKKIRRKEKSISKLTPLNIELMNKFEKNVKTI